jgi:hypothetical protein
VAELQATSVLPVPPKPLTGAAAQMTRANPSAETGPGEMSQDLAAAGERLWDIQADLRHALGSRRAYAAIIGMALIAARPTGVWLEGRLPDSLTPHEALKSADPDLYRTLDALDVRTALDDLYRTGLLGRTAQRIAEIIRSPGESEMLSLTHQLLKRYADPSIGLFTTPSEVADLASRLVLGMTDDSNDDALSQREIRLFDPRVGYGEMLLELARHVTARHGSANISGYEPSAEALGIAQANIILAGYPTADLHQEEWLLQPIESQQDFEFLVSAIPATPWHHLGYALEHTLALPARPRSTDSSLLYVARVARWITALPNSRAAIVVNSAALTTGTAGSGDVQLRRLIAEAGTLQAIIALPQRIFEKTAVAPTVLLFAGPTQARGREGFRLVDARTLGQLADRKRRILSPTDVDEIVGAALHGDSELTIELDSLTLAEDGLWRLPPFGTRTVSKRRHLEAGDRSLTDDDKELGELCDVLSGRNRVAKGSDRDPELRVIRAEDIGVELASWSDLPYSTRRRGSSVEVQPGDIIGSISPPHGRWVLVPEGYGRAVASDHTLVLRERADVSMWYVLGFLRSDRGKQWIASTFRGTIPRIARDELKRIPVPDCPIGSRYIDGVLRSYHGELGRLELEVDGLRQRLNDIYNGESSVEIAASVDGLHGIIASVRSIENLNGALRIAKSSFPYPISRTLRAIDRTVSPRAQYHEIVYEGLETVSTCLTALCAAVARDRSISGRAIKSWADAVGRNGATIGTQQGMVLEVANAVLSGTEADLGGLGQALGDANSPAIALMGSLLTERNRIHGDYPRTDFQFQQRLGEAVTVMYELLDSLSFLARWELRYAESVEPTEGDDGEPDFHGTFRVLRGDNPDWDLAEQLSELPLYRGRIYALVDGQRLVDLYPYLLVRDCPLCGAREVYYPDSVSGTEANLKSIDRGHPQVCVDPRVLRDLSSALGLFR